MINLLIDLIITSQTNLSVKGSEALNLKFPFDEKVALERSLNYLTRSLEVFINYLCSFYDNHVFVSSLNCGWSLCLLLRKQK